MRSIRLFILPILFSIALFSCEETTVIDTPLRASYAISSPDTGAKGLVHTYFGDRMDYLIFDSTHFVMSREALVGKLVQWYDGDNLWIRQMEGEYCSCIQLEGGLLDIWREDEWLQDFTYNESTSEVNGWEVNEGIAMDELGDTTWVALSTQYPNAWFENPTFNGLPLRYQYRLRGAKVTYEVDTIESIDASFDPSGYDYQCVKMPAEAFLGYAPQDTVFVGDNRVWVYGDLTNDFGEYINGELMVESFDGNTTQSAKVRVEQGTFDVELPYGLLYTLDLTADGMVHRRIEIDTRDVPQDGNQITMDLSMSVFAPENNEVDEYLSSTNVGIARYSADAGGIIFDFEYTEAVMAEVERLRNLDN
ncbi:MAG: hypothetical protein MK081_02545 [Flavobacteriales bacterium]|nr:hypothetical protein [Flavobacteriales bacterium]